MVLNAGIKIEYEYWYSECKMWVMKKSFDLIMGRSQALLLGLRGCREWYKTNCTQCYKP